MDKFTLTLNDKTITVSQIRGQSNLFMVQFDMSFAGYIDTSVDVSVSGNTHLTREEETALRDEIKARG
ncbi:hypothetical protein TH53_19820 [Pedobacter lusitanus]|uniref:Uncharacterized protein n=1 Tax=Pedobacter lusitanus TaxID=1503925 RepID=A0A0D0F1T3_9SPHI|nr:hypothetical protein TH53_19820 [Pedobacter lusitanus]